MAEYMYKEIPKKYVIDPFFDRINLAIDMMPYNYNLIKRPVKNLVNSIHKVTNSLVDIYGDIVDQGTTNIANFWGRYFAPTLIQLEMKFK
jgi:hypothetical protein